MRQFKITTANLTPPSDNDCVLDPSDPIHALMPASTLGGLGSTVALEKYIIQQNPTVALISKDKEARVKNLEPGTEAWFKHWFGDAR